MPGKPPTKRADYYTTQQVLERTLMSRFTLIRKVSKNQFPQPIKIVDDNPIANWYSKKEVDIWVANNTAFVDKRKLKISESITIEFTAEEVKRLRKATMGLETTVDRFIIDAVKAKTKAVLRCMDAETESEEDDYYA